MSESSSERLIIAGILIAIIMASIVSAGHILVDMIPSEPIEARIERCLDEKLSERTTECAKVLKNCTTGKFNC